jgi:peptidoglycan/LPS O-acetylase OafA/YrhL
VFFLALPALTPLPDVVTGLADLGLSASLGSLMLWIVTEPDHPAVALLDWAPLVYLGTISYGFYLFHNLVPARFGTMPALFARVPMPAFVRDALPGAAAVRARRAARSSVVALPEKRLLDFKKPIAAMLARYFVARPSASAR